MTVFKLGCLDDWVRASPKQRLIPTKHAPGKNNLLTGDRGWFEEHDKELKVFKFCRKKLASETDLIHMQWYRCTNNENMMRVIVYKFNVNTNVKTGIQHLSLNMWMFFLYLFYIFLFFSLETNAIFWSVLITHAEKCSRLTRVSR